MKKEDCRPGAIVKLPSGGPLMTVNSVCQDSPQAICVWFDDQKISHSDYFGIECLALEKKAQ